MDEQKELRRSTETKKDNKRYWGMAIGCGVALVIIICGCGLLGATMFGLLIYFGGEGEPEGLGLQTQYPWTVQKDESFELVLSITNSGNTTLLVEDIDLDEPLSGSILDGTVVERTEPDMEKDYSFGFKSFKFYQRLGPGESQDVIFHLRAIDIGDHGGTIAVYVGDQAVRQDVSISIFP
jgi:hypothetical protein